MQSAFWEVICLPRLLSFFFFFCKSFIGLTHGKLHVFKENSLINIGWCTPVKPFLKSRLNPSSLKVPLCPFPDHLFILSHQSLGRHWSTFCHYRRFPRLLHKQIHTTCTLGCFHSAWSHDCHPLYCISAISVMVSGGHSLLLLSSIPVFELFTVSLSIHLSWTFELFSVFSHNKIKCLCTFMCKVLYEWMSFNFPLVNAWE